MSCEVETIFATIPHQNFGYDKFQPNLDACFAKIGYTGGREPTLDVLRELHYRFTLTFPFENLSIFGLKHHSCAVSPVSVDPAIIEDKLLNQSRGGYCFEINQYFFLVIRALRFQVSTKAARVVWTLSVPETRPRSHLVSIVRIDGVNFLCDVGFGGASFVYPLLVDDESPQSTIYETHRVLSMPHPYPQHHRLVQVRSNTAIKEGVSSDLVVETGNGLVDESPEWLSMYFFDLHELSTVADWEQFNYVVCMHPQSLFTTHVLMARVTETGRVVLFDDKFTIKTLLPLPLEAGEDAQKAALKGTHNSKACPDN